MEKSFVLARDTILNFLIYITDREMFCLTLCYNPLFSIPCDGVISSTPQDPTEKQMSYHGVKIS